VESSSGHAKTAAGKLWKTVPDSPACAAGRIEGEEKDGEATEGGEVEGEAPEGGEVEGEAAEGGKIEGEATEGGEAPNPPL